MSILDWNLTLADGLAKVIGAELKVFYPAAMVLGRSVGIVSLGIDGRDVLVVWSDAQYDWDRLSTWNQVKTVVWGAGLAGVVFSSFWLAAAAGTASIGMTLYDELD